MATGTFTYNALRAKTLKERIKTQRKIVSHSNYKSIAVGVHVGTTAVKPYISICPVGLVWLASRVLWLNVQPPSFFLTVDSSSS